jgi:Ca2+-binding EF-hand superfamily protein
MRLFTAIGIAAAFATTVHAQGWGGGSMLERFDSDKDGKVSLAEYEAGRQMIFGRMDADGNGSVSFAEIDAMMQRMQGGDSQRAQMMQKRMEALKAADANGDQAISADEYKAYVDAEFKMLDKNGDGFLNPDELPQMGGGR